MGRREGDRGHRRTQEGCQPDWGKDSFLGVGVLRDMGDC